MRLDGGKVVDAWLARAPAGRHHLVYDALFAIADGTWATVYDHAHDVARHGIVLRLDEEEVLVFRHYQDLRDWFRVLYIGPPD